ncbi:hypothetical protein BH23ACT3_BH23ACT3_15720 [soil metagenome]
MEPMEQPSIETEARTEPDAARPVRVVIVDDQAPFRAVARTVIMVSPGFEVVGESASGEEAVTVSRELEPDLVLMDINLPGINGIEATRQIVDERPGTAVLLLSTYGVGDLPADALTCGATDYVHKEDFGPAVVADAWAQYRSRA